MLKRLVHYIKETQRLLYLTTLTSLFNHSLSDEVDFNCYILQSPQVTFGVYSKEAPFLFSPNLYFSVITWMTRSQHSCLVRTMAQPVPGTPWENGVPVRMLACCRCWSPESLGGWTGSREVSQPATGRGTVLLLCLCHTSLGPCITPAPALVLNSTSGGSVWTWLTSVHQKYPSASKMDSFKLEVHTTRLT